MRRACLMLLLTGCLGGLQNQPLEQGVVAGKLVGAGGPGALVFVLGHPELQVRAAADGSFALAHVPIGSFDVVASAASSAASSAGTLEPGESRQLGDVAISQAGAFRVQVRADEQPVARASVSISGTPLAGETDAQGNLRLGALPPGCYELRAALPSGERPTARACLNGQDLEVELEVSSDGGSGSNLSGCALSGCSGGLHCDTADGQCYACVIDADCPGRGACHDHACMAPLAPCDACSADWQCGAGGACKGYFDGGAAQCAYACSQDTDCGSYGYVCSSNVCEPRTDELSSCAAAGTLGSLCSGDGDCVAAGLIDGRCGPEGTCTVSCSSASDCPSGWSCPEVDGGFERSCQSP